MTCFAVLRVRKLKRSSDIEQCDLHNSRNARVQHAAKGKNLVKRLVGSGEMCDLIQNRIQSVSAKTRSDSVLANEVILSASPEYFRPNSPSSAGEFDVQRTKNWCRRSMAFARKTWGENLVSADLHLDESTPHLHLVVTPIAKKMRKCRGRDEYYEQHVLDANTMFGPTVLKELQTDYAEALKPLGIQRGLRGSLAKHQSVKSFYRLVNSSESPKKSFNLGDPPVLNKKGWVETKEKEVQALIAQKNAQIEFYKRKNSALKKSLSVLSRFGGFAKVKEWFAGFSMLKHENRELLDTNEGLAEKLESLEQRFDDKVTDEVERKVAEYKDAYAVKSGQLQALERSLGSQGPRPRL